MGNNLRTRGFTMLELLLGVGILAFLFTIVVVFLDPASILAETRDSTRISELQKLHDVIYLARISNSALLSNVQQNVIYVSLPDTDGDQYCNEYALPVVEAPWNYRCLASVETISNTDGNGWIPVNLSLVAQTQGGETLSRLPVDPKNNEAYFYTYNGGATVGSYSLVVRLESEKYVAQEASADGGLEENNEIFETVPVSYTPETPPETPPPPPLVPPSVTTTSASGITSTGAVLNAQGDPNGGSATGWFRYSTVDPGACSDSFGTRVPSSEGTNLGFGTDPVIFLRSLSGLLPDTIYYFCAIASNSAGSGFGSVLSFITSTPPTPLPNVTTNSASSIDSVSATLNGQANPNGSATTGWFRYSAVDPVTCNDSFGTRVPVLGGTNLGAGSASVPYSQNISSLIADTTYYFCAIASNVGGTGFGGILSFTTATAGGNNTPGAPTIPYVGYPSAQSGSSNPTNFVYSTPFFSAVYNDSDVGDVATKYRIQVTPASDIGYTTPVFDSGAAGTLLITSCNEGDRCEDIFYNGSSLLSEGQSYIWRIKFWDTAGAEGVWSSNGTIGTASETLTARFYVGPGDGTVYAERAPCCSGGTWISVRGLSVGDSVDSLNGSGWVGRTRNTAPSPGYVGIQRSFFPVDTSRLPDNANIQAGDLNVYVTDYNNYLGSAAYNYFVVLSGTQASSTVLVTEDYDQAGPVNGAPQGSDQITMGAAGSNGALNIWKTWTLNATGLPWVSRTSYTKLGIRDGFDLDGYYQDGKTQFSNYFSENPGISFDPYLEVTYKMPGQPIVTTSPATNISSVSADLNGSANPNGTSTTGWFRYSTSSPGTCNDSFGTRLPPAGGTSLGSGTSPASYDYTAGVLTSQVTYYFCAIASNSLGTGFGDVLSFATTAIAWVQRFIDNSVENQLIADITYDSVGGKYIAAGARESSGVYYATVWESTDLTNWTRRDVNTDVRSFLNSVVYANGKYVGAGFEDISGNYNAVVWESSNLINWTQRNVDTAASIQEIYAIIYANGKYIAAGADGGSPFGANAIVWESGDLISWTKRTVGAQDSWGTSITFANGKYIVGGYMNPGSNGQAVVWESPNLASWTKRTVDAGSGQATRITESIAYFNGKYLAVTWGDYLEGGNEPRGRIFESSDLINWTMHELSASPNQVNDINYRPADGLYVVGGHDGMWEEVLLFESTDLINWTKRTLSSGEADASIESVFYNPSDGKYMAAGYIDSTGGNANAVLWELW